MLTNRPQYKRPGKIQIPTRKSSNEVKMMPKVFYSPPATEKSIDLPIKVSRLNFSGHKPKQAQVLKNHTMIKYPSLAQTSKNVLPQIYPLLRKTNKTIEPKKYEASIVIKKRPVISNSVSYKNFEKIEFKSCETSFKSSTKVMKDFGISLNKQLTELNYQIENIDKKARRMLEPKLKVRFCSKPLLLSYDVI